MFTQFDQQKDDYQLPVLDELNDENQFNVDKYKVAGEILSRQFHSLRQDLQENQSLVALCDKYDALIKEEVGNVYKHKSFEKGIGFPTCISINNQAGYSSPWADKDRVLQQGDLVKIEMGVQIDGFPVVMADTLVLGTVLNGKQRQVMACLAVIKKEIGQYFQLGASSRGVHQYLKELVATYDCSLLKCDDEKIDHCPGIFTYQVSQGVLDGQTDDEHVSLYMGQSPEDYVLKHFEFEHNQCFIVDIAISSGKGQVQIRDPTETTVYRYNPDYYYGLKISASKKALHTLQEQNKEFPVSIRNFATTAFRFGLKECVANQIVEEYPVLYEKDGEYIGIYKFTVIIRKGNKKQKNKNILFTQV